MRERAVRLLMRLLSALALAFCACDPGGLLVVEQCPADGGCYCAPTLWDVDACHTVGPDYEPYCCTDHGGAIVQCGQPANCVEKPGIRDAGAFGANWCCRR